MLFVHMSVCVTSVECVYIVYTYKRILCDYNMLLLELTFLLTLGEEVAATVHA